jgi:hypothetical protein
VWGVGASVGVGVSVSVGAGVGVGAIVGMWVGGYGNRCGHDAGECVLGMVC